MAKVVHLNDHFFENTLVRYREVNAKSIEAVKLNRLYYSTPSYFNDPYDTRVFANPLAILKHVKENLDKGMDSYLENLKEQEIQNALQIHAIGYAMWNGKFKNRNVEQFLYQVYMAREQLQNSIKENSRIICLSETYLSMLMWSHYADNHKGFAIVYDKDKLRAAENFTSSDEKVIRKVHLCKVEYVEEQLDLSEEVEEYIRYNMTPASFKQFPIKNNLSQDKLRRMMVEKSPEWSYEKEWRILPGFISLDKPSELAYMVIKPKAVILGSMCSDEDQEKITQVCKNNFVPVIRAGLDSCSPGFRMTIE